MARVPRKYIVNRKGGFFHVVNRISGYPDEYPLQTPQVTDEFIWRLKYALDRSCIHCAEFVLMGNHFHLLVRMHPGEEYSDEEIKKRFLRKANTVGKPFPYNLILDGELYADEADIGASSPSERFQILTGLCRRVTLKPGDDVLMDKVIYKVYDCYNMEDPDMDFIDRHKLLTTALMGLAHVKVVENVQISDDDDVKPLHDQFVKEGYEGLMVRNEKGVYGLDKRSNNLLKYKDFQDAEYEIVGFKEGVGRSAGLVIWVCVDPKTGKTFNVKPDGNNAQRKEWFDNGDSYVGKEITVRFFELTADGLPRFPTGGWFRDYE